MYTKEIVEHNIENAREEIEDLKALKVAYSKDFAALIADAEAANHLADAAAIRALEHRIAERIDYHISTDEQYLYKHGIMC